MKKILFLFLGLLATISTKAQSYSVLSSASGSLVSFESIYDEDSELFGYAEVRKLDLIDKLTESYKYVILDKNMNTICSGEFNETLVKKQCYKRLSQIVYCDDKLLFNLREYFDLGPVNNSYQILDIKENKIISKGIFDAKSEDSENLKKLHNSYIAKYFSDIPKLGYVTMDFDSKEEGMLISAMGFDGKTIWNQPTKVAEEKHKYKYSLLNANADYTIINATKYKSSRKISDYVLILDSKTGKEVAFLQISNDDYTTLSYNLKIIKDQVITVGKYYEKDKRDEVEYDESLGLYRQVIDIKSGKLIKKDFLPYEKFGNLDINENGKIKKEGYLSFQRVEINPDGSYFVLAETFIPKSRGAIYSALYTFQLNKDFVPTKVTAFDTERTRGSKYSFSQKLTASKGKAYFFYDKNEDRKTELNVLTLNYASGDILQTKMPINNSNSSISVVPAKLGYVGLMEYFKNPKKEGKSMEIRLEKINYERQ